MSVKFLFFRGAGGVFRAFLGEGGGGGSARFYFYSETANCP